MGWKKAIEEPTENIQFVDIPAKEEDEDNVIINAKPKKKSNKDTTTSETIREFTE